MTRPTIGLLAFALAFAPAAFAQHHHGTHEHGVAQLRVAVDGRAVRVEFETPLDNLVGFEHAPRNNEQRRALDEAEKTLRDFERLFILPAAAACTVKAVDIESPWPQGGDKLKHDHKHGHDHSEAHTDLHATYDLECDAPQALNAMEVRVMNNFPRIHRLRAETATPRGQGGVTLSESSRMLPL